jgi:hypothetical protein
MNARAVEGRWLRSGVREHQEPGNSRWGRAATGWPSLHVERAMATPDRVIGPLDRSRPASANVPECATFRGGAQCQSLQNRPLPARPTR